MQPGRHLGSEEGILGSCSVVRKIMSVPCGAVSGDRSQMQPLLYGRLSFSAENRLPPSQTSSKTFSRYCGSLRLKRREKGGGGGFPSPPPSPFLPPDLSGVRGGAVKGPFLTRGAQASPLAPGPLRARRRARGASSRRSLSFYLGVPRNRRASQTPRPLPPCPAEGSAAAGGGAAVGACPRRRPRPRPPPPLGARLRESSRRIYFFFPQRMVFPLCAFCPSQVSGAMLGSLSRGSPRTPSRGPLGVSLPGGPGRGGDGQGQAGGTGGCGSAGGAGSLRLLRSPRGSRARGERRLTGAGSCAIHRLLWRGETKPFFVVWFRVVFFFFFFFLAPGFKITPRRIVLQTSLFAPPIPGGRESLNVATSYGAVMVTRGVTVPAVRISALIRTSVNGRLNSIRSEIFVPS